LVPSKQTVAYEAKALRILLRLPSPERCVRNQLAHALQNSPDGDRVIVDKRRNGAARVLSRERPKYWKRVREIEPNVSTAL
jgi:hypothetical protein